MSRPASPSLLWSSSSSSCSNWMERVARGLALRIEGLGTTNRLESIASFFLEDEDGQQSEAKEDEEEKEEKGGWDGWIDG
ncbi:hypothetical protein TCAL_16997 [Tigriopus californicus]|uniref:Uncharacterized protein n=1 Tax=Tigriopus californicus TaxID=6832 RepID=A0A553PGL3_TIGCA|nr:hypothetical protein TCAL_16997 [Tigriopus californicus]